MAAANDNRPGLLMRGLRHTLHLPVSRPGPVRRLGEDLHQVQKHIRQLESPVALLRDGFTDPHRPISPRARCFARNVTIGCGLVTVLMTGVSLAWLWHHNLMMSGVTAAMSVAAFAAALCAAHVADQGRGGNSNG